MLIFNEHFCFTFLLCRGNLCFSALFIHVTAERYSHSNLLQAETQPLNRANILLKNTVLLILTQVLLHWYTGSAFCPDGKCYLSILYESIQLIRLQLLRSDSDERHTIQFQRFAADGSKSN